MPKASSSLHAQRYTRTIAAILSLSKIILSPYSYSNITCNGIPQDVTDALSTMLRLLGEELEEASWLI